MSETAPRVPIDRPAQPKTPVEVLLTTWKALDPDDAARTLEEFRRHGFLLQRAKPLTEEQAARAEALRTAREVVAQKAVLGSASLTAHQAAELVPLARFILTGSEFIEPPQRYLLGTAAGPLGEPVTFTTTDEVDHHDQGDVADVLRTPEALRKAMRSAAAARP